MNQRIRSVALALGRLPAGWWVVLLTLPALVPLLPAGFFESHDGLFHAYRLEALDRAVRAGALYPRWFSEFAFGYGHPVLNFYGPLSYYWGLPFTLLGLDAAPALALVFASGLIASALALYRFARLHLPPLPAVVAAVVYAYLPYHLVDLYVRGALAEFLAFVWYPLILWAFHRLVAGRLHIAWAALLVVALVLTHSLSALIFAPVLLAYVLVLLIRRRDPGALGRLALAGLLAGALSAFYWLPVLAESSYVGLGSGASRGYQGHLLPLARLFSFDLAYPYPTESGLAPTFPLGLVQVGLLAAALVLAVGRRRWSSLFFLALALGSACMLTRLSLPAWRLLEPGLAFLQYPWRFQSLTGLATAFLAGALLQAAGNRRPAAVLPVAAGLLLVTAAWALWRLPVRPASPDLSVEAMWRGDRYYGQVGATWTGEYLPIWVSEQRWAISHPATDAAATDASVAAASRCPAGQFRLTAVGYNRYDFWQESPLPAGTILVLHQFYFPGWEALESHNEGLAYEPRPAGVLGLTAFDLPPRDGPLSVRFGHTPARLWGSLLSLTTALALGIALLVPSRRSESRGGDRLLAAGCLLLALILLVHLLLPNGIVHPVVQVNANLEDTAELLSFAVDRDRYQPGDTVEVTLYWRALRRPQQDYKTFVHLTDAALSHQPAQHDGDPGGGFTPTTRWLAGEVMADRHPLALPGDLSPGTYQLWAGMYEFEPLRNLDVVASQAPVVDNRILLGEIEVVAR